MERKSDSSDGEEKGGKQRVQFELTYRELAQLKRLMELMGAASRVEVLRRVLGAAMIIFKAQGSGGWTEVTPKDGPPYRIFFS
jgi:hypothetical protein